VILKHSWTSARWLAADGKKYFNDCQGLTMTSPAFHDHVRGPPRPWNRIDATGVDLAASVQWGLKRSCSEASNHVQQVTGSKRIWCGRRRGAQ